MSGNFLGERRLITVVATAILATGCGSGGTTADSAKAVDTAIVKSGGPGSFAAGNVGDVGLSGYPGQDKAATRKYLHSLGWADDYDPGDLVDEGSLGKGANAVSVRIVPTVRAYDVDWEEALHMNGKTGNGRFVAKIYNLEDKDDALGLGKLGTGYVWIGQLDDKPANRGVGIFEVKHNGDVRLAKSLRFDNFCPTPHTSSKTRLTDGQLCDPKIASTAAAGLPNEPRAKFILASMAQDSAINPGQGLWITCRGGCCEVKLAN